MESKEFLGSAEVLTSFFLCSFDDLRFFCGGIVLSDQWDIHWSQSLPFISYPHRFLFVSISCLNFRNCRNFSLSLVDLLARLFYKKK